MAKKFRFRLESILKIRGDKVEETKNALNIALRYRYEKEAEIDDLQQTKQVALSKPITISKASDMQSHRDYINGIDATVTLREQEKTKLIEIENSRRSRLNEAMKEEKVIAKLKEKKLEEYKMDLAREETNFLDEIATQQFFKKKTAERVENEKINERIEQEQKNGYKD
ncbi:MAG: flagellar export protein FliJ [Ignavibacteria bacterium]|jgi:flagellar FliJ protein|nr:flagellar export protein FliJ [Ignavibacteria bacterium]